MSLSVIGFSGIYRDIKPTTMAGFFILFVSIKTIQ